MDKKDILRMLCTKRAAVFALMLILSVACMVIIFGFSSQVANESATHSNRVTDYVVKLVDSQHEKPDKYDPDDLYYKVDRVVRKTGHILIFALLGVLTYFAVKSFPLISIIGIAPEKISFLLCVIYAVSDELHQTLVKGRSGRIRDVIIDTAGVVIGIFISKAVERALRKKNTAEQEVEK